MSRAAARVCTSPRGVLAVVLVLAAVVVTILQAPTAAQALAAATETEPTEESPAPDATCEVSLQRTAQLVACTAEGMAPHGAAAITVTPSGDASSPSPYIGGTTVGADGTARLEAEVPCGVAGSSEVEVSASSADGGRFRHVAPVELQGRCRAAWELTTRESAAVLATVVFVAAAILVAVMLRRRRRRGRRRRSVRGGHAGKRSRTRRDAGRRRSPRRRRHHRRR